MGKAMTFGDWLRVSRQLNKLTTRQLAEKSNVSAATISRIERNHGATLVNAEKLAQGFGLKLSEVFRTIEGTN